MATRNYRQEKRNREETRKKRQQEKLAQKLSRGASANPAQEPPAPDVEINPKETP